MSILKSTQYVKNMVDEKCKVEFKKLSKISEGNNWIERK